MRAPPPPRRTERSRSALLAIVTAVVTLSFAPLSAQQPASAGVPAVSPELEKVRAGLERYRDPIAAVRDGYFSTVGCVEYPAGGREHSMHYAPGGMGVHFLNMGYVGPTLDAAKPQVLIYEPDGDKLRLVAAEWFVPAQAVKQAPAIFGRKLDGPMEGHEPVMPKDLHHYDLHVWLWKANPAGVFSPTNPAVKCPARGYSFAERAPNLVPAPAP
jgi:hypothetical protein